MALGGSCTSDPEPRPASIDEPSTPPEAEYTGGGGRGGDEESCSDVVPVPTPDDREGWANALARYSLEGPTVWCLGENDHGVAESTAVYLHLLRHLIVEHDVRTIGVESVGATADHLNRYVATGDEAEIDQAFREIPGSLAASDNRREFYKELRSIGRSLNIDLRIEGFDVAVQRSGTIDALSRFLDDAEVETSRRETCLDAAPVDAEVAAEACGTLVSQLEGDRAELEATVGSDRVWRGIRDARNLESGHRFLEYQERGSFSLGSSFREGAMLANIERIRTQVGSERPLVLTAHNSHCGSGYRVGRDPETAAPQWSFGSALEESLGQGYQAIGQFYLGGIRTSSFSGGEEAYPDTSNGLEAAIAAVAVGPGAILPTSTCAVDLTERMRTGWGDRVIAADSFQHLIWLREVSATTLE
ncbi:MAG: erythromycin esterase family protein [Myxococcota bacterium]